MTIQNYDKDENEVQLPYLHFAPDVFSKYSTHIDKVLKAISDLTITDEITCRLAQDASSDAKLILDEIIAIKKKITAHPRQFINLVNEAASCETEKLAYIQQMIKQKIEVWDRHCIILQEVAQKATQNNLEALGLDLDVIVPNDQKIRSSAKTIVSHKVTKEFSVIDESLIPREYLMVDEKKLAQAVKAGVWNIPGIEIKEIKKIALRRR